MRHFLRRKSNVVLLMVVLIMALLWVTPAAASCNPSDGGTPENDSITCAVGQAPDGGIVAGDLGSDTIIVNSANQILVSGDLRLAGGFTVMPVANGGNDTIIINGHVAGFVTGDQVQGNGGDDTIHVNAPVDGEVIGDYVQGGNGGDDRIFIASTVDAVRGDEVQSGVGGDDYIELQDGASVRQVIDGEGGKDTLAIGFTVTTAAEEAELAALLAGVSPQEGSLTFRGITYSWLNFEQVIRVAPFETVSLSTDGGGHITTVGTLAAVYATRRQGIQVYAIDSSSQGSLVASISARDLARLPDEPSRNILLNASADGRYAIYKLTTGEYQVNIGPFGADGKVAVTIWRGIPARDIKRSEFFVSG
jgi:hypothetical protein